MTERSFFFAEICVDENTGNEPIELIVFYIGEKGTPLSVNK